MWATSMEPLAESSPRMPLQGSAPTLEMERTITCLLFDGSRVKWLLFFLAANPALVLRLLDNLLRQLARHRIVMRKLHVETSRARR